MDPVETGLGRWHSVVANHDAALLVDLVADGAVFRSPAVFRPQKGRDLVVAYLSAALTVLGGDFHYERQWLRDTGAVLEFRCAVDGREVHGVDMIEFDGDGLIVDFTVMVRPLSALNLVVEKMGAELKGRFGPPA
jgi:SnoaL-like domain